MQTLAWMDNYEEWVRGFEILNSTFQIVKPLE